jgi:ribonuclease III
MNNNDHVEIERKLGYRFHSPDFLEEALRHSSFVNEQPDLDLRDNERFEFLGDAVLNLVVGQILMRRYPDLKEGDLSRMRANLVNESQLARIARAINLGSFIRLGKGEIQTMGREKNSILADTFEALIAAVYLDGGFHAAFKLIDENFSPLLEGKSRTADHHDYKSKLQEMVQEKQGAMPKYRIIREEGPDHEKTFWIELEVFDIETQGSGKSKKMAEQDAARKALEILKKESQ